MLANLFLDLLQSRPLVANVTTRTFSCVQTDECETVTVEVDVQIGVVIIPCVSLQHSSDVIT